MTHKIGWLLVWVLLIGPGCGGGEDESSGGSHCEKLCENEAHLNCASSTLEGCTTGCQTLFDDIADMNPDCIDERDALFECTSNVPTSSIRCDPDSGRPTYDGACMAQNVAFAQCRNSALP